ncbi:hypothetical protein C2S53_010184 [Perilla frutescens var. hirtella]|uniref:Organ specific protein n=1 Tax=Perilla frutescens var. hirtella TaxID=608512 RepID=A0AAD4JCG8_PERFH|nr:hypothetical protein C2S53_010184 [Perilla frutescens var. hirtella]
MESKASSAFFLLSLLMFAYVSDARKDPGDYWKSVMDEETMPKAIKDLVNTNPTSNSNMKTDRFVRNFDVKPNVIIYHSHDHTHTEKQIKPSDMEG